MESLAGIRAEELEIYKAILEEWAAKVAASKSRRKHQLSGILAELAGPIIGATVPVGKRARGGQPTRPGRFFTNPNRVAAAIARERVFDLREMPDTGSKRRPYKVAVDGSMMKVREAASRFAVDLVNEYYIPLLVSDPRRRREANYDTVLSLIQRNRAKWPQGPSWG